ncbi:MAG: DUF429 domain-containing protein [Chloroflexota bacterium]
MKLYGIDLTSAPRKRKPITVAACDLEGGILRVTDFESLTSFAQFEALLQREGPWVAGMDFPFGQPLKLIRNLELPDTWAGYVSLIDAMGKRAWVDTVEQYMSLREKGDKLHFRTIDRVAGAQSPMKMSFIPVGRMFYEGAPRLLNSGVSVMPNHPTDDNRLVFEIYPALVARKFVGRGSGYKSDDSDRWTDEAHYKRQTILDGLRAECADMYGFGVDLPDELADEFVSDPTGDKLDTLLAAVQAGWAYGQRENNYGIPPGISPLEGWIVEPDLLEKYVETQGHR